jgi:ATP-binding cassette subfamily B protein
MNNPHNHSDINSITSQSIYSRLYPYIKPHIPRVLLIILALIIVAGSILYLGQGIKYTIDFGLGARNTQNLNHFFMTLIILIIVLSIASYLRSSNVNLLCEKIELEIKKDAYKNMIGLSPEFYESYKTSDIISRLTNDLTVVNSIVSTTLSFALRNSIMLFGGMIFLIATDWQLTAYVLMLLPFAVAPIILIGRKIRKYSLTHQEMIANLSAKIEESINNIKTIQSFVHEQYDIANFTFLANQLHAFAKKRIITRAIMFAIVIFIVLTSILFVLWIGGLDVISGRMTAGELSSFIYYSLMVATSGGGLTEVFGDLQRARASVERVIALLDYKSDILDGTSSLLQCENFNIEFNKVTFSYPARPHTKALGEFSFCFRHGNSYALVGKSGAGKTTIFELLHRFYEYHTGSILIGNVNIRDLKLQDLRSIIATVPQDPVIFSATVIENIRFGYESATFEQIENASKIAEIYDFIISLPQGFDTYLGEKGIRLSGGQKQRIAIARAMLKNPQILLLDEATSSLDSENEALVLKAIEKISSKRTTITIAHRLSTVQNANHIILLEDGQIHGSGTHSELYGNNNLYKALWDAQSNSVNSNNG